MEYNKILTDDEFMEIKQHGNSDYPFQYYYDHSSIIMTIWNYLISSVLNGTGTENLNFYM